VVHLRKIDNRSIIFLSLPDNLLNFSTILNHRLHITKVCGTLHEICYLIYFNVDACLWGA